MNAAAHILAFMFAAPAGALAYCAIGRADHPEIDMRHLLGAVLLFGFVLLGMPDLTEILVLYFGVGTILGAHLIGQGQPTPPVQDGRRQRQSTRTRRTTNPPPDDPSEEPVIWDDQ